MLLSRVRDLEASGGACLEDIRTHKQKYIATVVEVRRHRVHEEMAGKGGASSAMGLAELETVANSFDECGYTVPRKMSAADALEQQLSVLERRALVQEPRPRTVFGGMLLGSNKLRKAKAKATAKVAPMVAPDAPVSNGRRKVPSPRPATAISATCTSSSGGASGAQEPLEPAMAQRPAKKALKGQAVRAEWWLSPVKAFRASRLSRGSRCSRASHTSSWSAPGWSIRSSFSSAE